MFTARRPDVCATGDLGLQKGLLIWYTTPLAQPPPAKAEKLPLADKKNTPAQKPETASATEPPIVPATPTGEGPSLASIYPTPLSPTATTAPLADGLVKNEGVKEEGLKEEGLKEEPKGARLPSIPEGCNLTHAAMRSRLAGNKVKGGMYLSSAEMEQLTEHWRPFRSVGLYYMWSLVDG